MSVGDLKPAFSITMTKKHLSRPKYPIDELPFEAFHDGSWHGIKDVMIKNGSVTVQFEHHGYGIWEIVPTDKLRLRPRKAIPADCRCFLRPGMDICIFSVYTSSTQENVKPAWHDAKIISIEKKPHDYRCACKFSVSIYRNRDPLGKRKRTLENDIEKLTIENIAILQKLNKKTYKDGCYHWDSSEDCFSVDKSKLFVGAFFSEVSWLVVLSILNDIDFHIRSIGDKIVYLVLKRDQGAENQDRVSLDSNDVNALSFHSNNGKLQLKIESFVLPVPECVIVTPKIIDMDPVHDIYGLAELRCSTRQKAPPDRFVGCNFSNGKRHTIKSSRKPQERDVLLSPANDDISGQMNCLKEQNKGKIISHTKKDESNKKFYLTQSKIRLQHGKNCFNSIKQENSSVASGSTGQCKLAESHEKVRNRHKRNLEDVTLCKEDPDSINLQKQNKKHCWVHDSLTDRKYLTNSRNKGILTRKTSSGCPPQTKSERLLVQVRSPKKLHHVIHQKTCIEKIDKSSKHLYKSSSTIETNKVSETNDMEVCLRNLGIPDVTNFRRHGHGVSKSGLKQKDLHTKLQSGKWSSLDKLKQKGSPNKLKSGKVSCLERLKQKGPDIKLQKGKGSSQSNKIRSSRKCRREERRYRRRFFTTSEYKQIVERYMKNIEHEMGRQQPLVVAQWEAKQSVNKLNSMVEFNWPSDTDDLIQITEHEDLWNDMENALTAFPVTACQEESMGFSDAIAESSHKGGRQSCQHEYMIDEEVGIICPLCNFVITEIRYVSSPFLRRDVWIRSDEQCSRDKLEWMGSSDLGSDPFGSAISSREMSTLEQCNSVWALIPKLKTKLHEHQKKAFEFLWKNLAGSLNPEDMQVASEKWGGCVISHPPGSGKTLLVMSFLESYLSLFPQRRPLVLAPNTALYAWYKEFEKWEVSFPVHQIHALRTYQKERKGMQAIKNNESMGDLTRDGTILHITDCLEKLRKWHEQPSVLLMSYPTFFAMTRIDSKFAHRRYMAEILRKSPGILILDEGHNPRSTRSKLRRALMEVKTDLRILLSGTLFQNNFEEYFNTLCLARPRFINEVATELKINIRKQGKRAIDIRREMLARKHFVDKIAKRINSNVKVERERGLEMLKKITNGFIDVYNGITLDGLPGLQCYTLLMNPTDMQQKILSRLKKLSTQKRFPLEIELLITFASIHPWLIKTVSCVGKYFSKDELENLDIYKFNIGKGSKAKFVIDLVRQCILKKEKVLIFCRNIPPINLFVEIFEAVFGWKKNREVLVLNGEMDLIERSKVMDQFKEYSGSSQLLLASTGACAEGISLTAASRVVMLDSEWNPSKTKQAIARAFRPGQERVVYVYQLLASGTLEEEKSDRNELKERQSRMIFTGDCIKDSSYRQTGNIDDDVLREIVEEDQMKAFNMILKHDKAYNSSEKVNEELH